MKEKRIMVVGNYMKSDHNASRIVDEEGIAPTVMENHGTVTGVVQKMKLPTDESKEIIVGEEKLIGDFRYDEGFRVRENGLSPTINSAEGGGLSNGAPIVFAPAKNINGVVTEDGTLFPMISKYGRLWQTLEKMNTEKGIQFIDTYNQQTNENAQTITSRVNDSSNFALYDGFIIRKLTPKECWRLMGFDDDDYEKAAKVNSKSALYKQAGNSIVVNVLEAIFSNLFFDKKDEGYRQTDIWDFL